MKEQKREEERGELRGKKQREAVSANLPRAQNTTVRCEPLSLAPVAATQAVVENSKGGSEQGPQ